MWSPVKVTESGVLAQNGQKATARRAKTEDFDRANC